MKTSRDLYASIEETKGTASETGSAEGADKNALASADSNAGNGTNVQGSPAKGTASSGLPLGAILVLVSGILLASVAVFAVSRLKRNKQEEEENR